MAKIELRPMSERELRTEVARTALCSVSYLMATLGREKKLAEENQDVECGLREVWSVLSGRIHELTGAALSAIDDEQEKTRDLADIVFGEWTMADEEMCHG